MIGNIIQRKFLTEFNYPEAAALSVILMLGMLVLALIYAKVLGTEDDALAAAAGVSAVATAPSRPPRCRTVRSARTRRRDGPSTSCRSSRSR